MIESINGINGYNYINSIREVDKVNSSKTESEKGQNDFKNKNTIRARMEEYQKAIQQDGNNTGYNSNNVNMGIAEIINKRMNTAESEYYKKVRSDYLFNNILLAGSGNTEQIIEMQSRINRSK